jgi:hypothetical protein
MQNQNNDSFVARKLEEHEQIKNNIIEGLQRSLKQKTQEMDELH